MSKYRVLLDEKLEHHARPLLNDVGIKADIEDCQIEEVVKCADIISIHTSGEEQAFLIDQVF